MSRLPAEERAALLERFRTWLRDHHLPLTRPRAAVAEALFAAETHPSAEQAERDLRARGVRVGTATVYRTLDLLVAAGLARAHDFGGRARRFEAVRDRDPGHGHLVCTRCGQVVEFGNDWLERALPMIADEHGFAEERYRVDIFGLCRTCRQRDLERLGA